jgi:hypothetical protein
MWKNIFEPGRPQMTGWCMRIACWITKAINTHRMCNTYCFSTATMITRTRLSVTLYVHCLSCFENVIRIYKPRPLLSYLFRWNTNLVAILNKNMFDWIVHFRQENTSINVGARSIKTENKGTNVKKCKKQKQKITKFPLRCLLETDTLTSIQQRNSSNSFPSQYIFSFFKRAKYTFHVSRFTGSAFWEIPSSFFAQFAFLPKSSRHFQ